MNDDYAANNLVAIFISQARSIEIDKTPSDDGNDAYSIEIETFFRLHKTWLDEEEELDGYTQTLRCVDVFYEELNELFKKCSKKRWEKAPYLGLYMKCGERMIKGVRETVSRKRSHRAVDGVEEEHDHGAQQAAERVVAHDEARRI